MMTYMPSNKHPKCDFTSCIAGSGLAGSGQCFRDGKWWVKKCPKFKKDEGLMKARGEIEVRIS